MTSRVSIVMANYNYARYLRAAIDSVLSQTYSNFELIVVDDGSTDNSRSIIESYSGESRVCFQPVNHLGQPGAKNAGIELARGSLIAFLDADDLWHPEKLAKQVAVFNRDPNVGVVYSRRTLIDENDRQLAYAQPPLYRGDVCAAMFRDNFVCFSSVMVKRLVFEHVGLFDPITDLAIDYDLWLRVVPHYRFEFVDEPLVQYRCGHGNLSKRIGERLKIAALIGRRFVARDRHGLPKATIRSAMASTFAHMGIAVRPFDAWASAKWFVKSLVQDWRYGPAWRGLLGAAVPGGLRRQIRRFSGRGDWESAYRTPENDPRNI